MLFRALLVLVVGVLSFLTVSAGLSLARSPLAQIAVVAAGMAPLVVALLIILRMTPPAHAGDARSRDEKERELLRALEEHGELTPAAAALHTSLTAEEAAVLLAALTREGRTVGRSQHASVAPVSVAQPPDEEAIDRAVVLPSPGGRQRPPVRPDRAPSEDVAALVEPLSEREREVLALLAAGRPNKEIAARLVVTVGTVKTHTNNIYRKLGARNRTEAVAMARDLDLL